MSSAVTIDHEWWDAQRDTLQALGSDSNDLVVFRGGYGSGKTVLGARWIIRTALRIPNGHSLVLAPDRQKGGPATYKGFFEQLPGENTVPNEADGDPENSPIVAGYHGTKHRVTLPNGHLIQLGGADRWNRFAGSEFNAIWCDEVAHYENTDLYDLHEMLITRQRTAQGPNVTLWTSTGNGYNQFYDVTERKVQPDGEGGEEKLPWRDTMRVIVANSLNNPFLNEKEKMKRQFAGTEREKQALAGGFAAAEGLVYGQFSRNTHVRDDETMPELRDEWYYGYDHGWDDPRVMLQIGKTVHDQYAIVDEFYESQAKVSKAVEWLKDRPKGTVYAEHEPEHIELFRSAGYTTEKAVKDLDEGIPLVREFLEVDDEGRPGLLVHDDCVNTIQEFQSYKEEHVGKSKATDHACLIGSTQILTPNGSVDLSDIEAGDMVLTRSGFRPVKHSGVTEENADVWRVKLSNGQELVGTGNHPIHTPHDGFKQLDSLRHSEPISSIGMYPHICQELKKLSTTASRSDVIPTATTWPIGGIIDQVAPISRMALRRFTGRNGKITTGTSPKDTTSTTKTATQRTTTLKTSNASVRKNTPSGILKSVVCKARNTLKRCMKPPKDGMRLKRGENGTANIGTNLSGRPLMKQKRGVNNVGVISLTKAPTTVGGFAPMPAKRQHGGNEATTTKRGFAKRVNRNTSVTNTATERPVRVLAVERLPHGADVYNLEVDGKHEYFANGVLTHNCDSLRYVLATRELDLSPSIRDSFAV